MNRRTLSLLAIAGLTLPILGGLSASQLQAQVGGGPGRGDGFRGESFRGDRAEQLIETLDLSDDQTAQIRAIREGNREEMRTLHDNLRAEREALHDLMAGTAPDADLQAQHEIVQTLHREVADQRFANMLAVRNVLTPEQRTEIAERMEQRRESRRDRLQERHENRQSRRSGE